MKRRQWLIGLICLLLLIWGLSLARCEILTALYGEATMNSACLEQTMIEADAQFKILEYRPFGYAKLYARERAAGSLLLLVRDYQADAASPWKVVYWETIWSDKGGSADGLVWPYLR